MSSIISHIIGRSVFILTVLICFLIARSNTVSKRETSSNKRKFWDRESEANSVRRKDISGLDYIRIPLDALPMNALLNNGLNKIHETLMDMSDRKILNLSGYTNTDLKMMYGPANLDELTQCDENYTTLIRTLHNAGKKLAGTEEKPASPEAVSAAIDFLEYSISIGSDMSVSYELLGNLYLDADRREDFDKLFESAEQISSISKPVVISKLNSIKSKWK